MPRMRIGVLTGGGDCPGLNAVIRGVVRAGVNRLGHEIVGFRYGWAGVLERNIIGLTPQSTAGILHRGGTILGTSRTNPYKGGADGTATVRATLEAEAIDALIPIGGEDTLGVAGRLSADGIPVVGVPKTIDNDLAGTDVTFGFHTAVQIATDAIDRLHTTAESHNRVIVVPERPFDIDEVCERIKRRHARGTTFSIVVVSEGALPKDGSGITTASTQTDAFGHERLGGIGVALEGEIEARTGFETRMTILGHVQRGGTPTAYDRVLATRFGVRAIEAVHEGRYGTMVALRGTDIVLADLADAVAEPKLLDPALYDVAEVFFG